jgi:hypothetical protein
VLGPSLFLIFINELCDIQLHSGRIIAFADDTALVFRGDSWEEVYGFAQRGFNIVMTWLRNNALTLNVNKTKFTRFALKTPSLNSNFSITAHTCSASRFCYCDKIEFVENIKYLGVVIDSRLSFDSHLDLLSSRTRKLMYIFRNLRHIADKYILKLVYRSLCESILSYCITVWGGACKHNLLKVERAQRAVLKVAHSKPFLFPTKNLFRLADVLSVRQLFILSVILKQHSMVKYDPSLNAGKRLKHKVCRSDISWATAFSRRFFGFLGSFLYNKTNKELNIYHRSKYECKKITTEWLKCFDYDNTEKLLTTFT